MLAGEQPTIYGDGEQSRDFTYVSIGRPDVGVGDRLHADPAWADHLPTVCKPSLSGAGKCGGDQEDGETTGLFSKFARLHLHRSALFL
jgi:hypothetical protein